MALRFPTLFLSHGGGPFPFMAPPAQAPQTWDRLTGHLKGIAGALPRRPRALLIVSAHWEEDLPTVHFGAQPPLLYDYSGFPENTYRLSYPAPGDPALATRVAALLSAAGIESGRNEARGWDHGLFIPMMLAYPEADVPIVQLSMRRDLDPAAHIALGRALEPLRDEDVLIIGSGFSFHNLRTFFTDRPDINAAAEAFDAWLTRAVETPDIPARDAQLTAWAGAPGGLLCHPRSDHLTPLFVAAGAGGDDLGRQIFSDRIFGKAYSSYQFG